MTGNTLPDTVQDEPSPQVDKKKTGMEELSGQLSSQTEEDKLMHSVLDADKDKIEEGDILNDAMNQGMSSFTPDMMFDQMVKNYNLAKNIYGEKILRKLSGYDPNYIEKNINIPEFQREVKSKISEKVKKMKKDGLLDKENKITSEGTKLATLVLYRQELDKLKPKGLQGPMQHEKRSFHGISDDVENFSKGKRYRDIALKQSVKTAIRRGHSSLQMEDLKAFTRKSKGKINIIYAIDSSGSMKGAKIDKTKRAGVALAFKSIEEKNKVGIIIFGEKVEKKIDITTDFMKIVTELTDIKASKETNLIAPIKEAIEMFPHNKDSTNHLILLTDALPNLGDDPQKQVLEMAGLAANRKITISLVGMNLDREGEKLARQIVEIGQGKLYIAKETDDIDKLVLEDYYSL